MRDALEKCFTQVSLEDKLRSLRTLGWERFQTLGLPDKKTEAFRYVALSKLYAGCFEESNSVIIPEYLEHIYPECQGSHIVFVNGSYVPELSKIPQGIVVLPLAEAMITYVHFLKNRFARILQDEKDPFASLNAALHDAGVFIYVPPKQVVLQPLQCHHIFTDSRVSRPRIHLFMGAFSELDLIMTVQSQGECASWVSGLIDIALEEGASLKQSQLYYGLKSIDWFFESLRATLKKNSRLYVVSVTTGSATVRQDYHATLSGEGADATLQGIWMLKERREAHTHVVVNHEAPHCRSMQLFKGVLDESSKSSFEGKIYVQAEAQKTEAYQLNKHLLLGDCVIANSKPNLEIFADDVKASHGATMTQVAREELFYLKTRGISEKAAKALLIHGFCQEIIEKIPQLFVRKKIQDLLL